MGFLKDRGVVYKPVDEIDLRPQTDAEDDDRVYLQANVKAPRMAGFLVKLFVWFLESRIFGPILKYFLIKNNRVHKLVSFAEFQESPLYVPLHQYTDYEENDVKCLDADLSPPEKVQEAVDCVQALNHKLEISQKFAFYRWTILDYSRAYASQQLTPLMVAERLIAAVKESSFLHMSFFINFDTKDILRQAMESTLRYERGEPISVLDGVPVAVKDEIDCTPYPTTGGTKWLHKARSCKEDACCVKRLRLCGALLVGKTNMHELGAGTSGINPHYGATRNPYNTNKISGGSSSGSAAVVSAGLCPVALGVDGGGSVRMPAALCGVIGFKPTFGRIPHDGVLPLNHTVGMVGVLAATVEDTLIAYAAISGNLSSDTGMIKPKVSLPMLNSKSYKSNVRMAKYAKWFDDCADDIRLCCSNALAKLSSHYGWKIVDVTIPEIENMRLAHYVTIGSECSTSIACQIEKLNAAELGWDVRVALPIYGAFSSREYLNAQKMRYRQMRFHQKIFAIADVIVTPTTGVTAYSIKADAFETGELDYINGAALVRYSIAGNFLGLPAVTIPIGYDKSGLPIGLQFIGKPWSESYLIHIASAVQEICISEYRRPEVFFDLHSKAN